MIDSTSVSVTANNKALKSESSPKVTYSSGESNSNTNQALWSFDDAMKMDPETVRNLQLAHLNKLRTIHGHARNFVKAENSRFVDEKGQEHLDLIGGVGVVTVGNNNEYVWDCLQKCFNEKLYMMGAISYRNLAAAFSRNMALLSPGQKLTRTWTATGGAEANEGVIKLARLATRYKINKKRFLSTLNSFHGKTTGSVFLGGKEKWQKYQGPPPFDVDYIPYGDFHALEVALASGIYRAFVVEPIQGEGGVIVPPPGYLAKARELCTKYETYLVLDEIQTGCGRTGKFWACEHENVIPDCISFAKGFSGGLVPFGGYIATEELWNAAYGTVETAFLHTATYQENTLGLAAGVATIDFIYQNNLLDRANKMGAIMFDRLSKHQSRYPHIIKEVRGRGMMIGIEFYPLPASVQELFGEFYATPVVDDLANKHHVQVYCSLNNPSVFRFLPPLTIPEEDLDEGMEAVENAITAFDSKVKDAVSTKAA
ncbi:aminotransferase class-III [Schizosaccharomyces osmophilus]|uniref:Aminotransferase class-III n=1 Tax=Schizosaccharomyces osmophilus TaxID=2545709 RepID=A0AAE9WEX0_9SCHI|nr:aminotransferase class-III [Schizosaccharomyces osmophilus]WBW74001.1 aminotransferase class-III [Schizosaccharomyces osmophilus]